MINYRKNALAALDLIKRDSATVLAPRLNYSRLKEGAKELERLLPRVKPSNEPLRYGSFQGEQQAIQLERATLDDTLAVVIEPHPCGGWRCDVILTFTALGSEDDHPLATREDAEECALAILGAIGRKAEPPNDYERPCNAEDVLQIRMNGDLHYVSRIPPTVLRGFLTAMQERWPKLTPDGLAAALALAVINDPKLGGSLTILANLGWTHVSAELVDQYCFANGVDSAGLSAIHSAAAAEVEKFVKPRLNCSTGAARGAPDAIKDYLRNVKPSLLVRFECEGEGRGHLSPFIAETYLGWDEVIDEGYDEHNSPLGPVYWRIVRRGSEELYLSTFLASRDAIVKAWGAAGLAFFNPERGSAAARIETHLRYYTDSDQEAERAVAEA